MQTDGVNGVEVRGCCMGIPFGCGSGVLLLVGAGAWLQTGATWPLYAALLLPFLGAGSVAVMPLARRARRLLDR